MSELFDDICRNFVFMQQNGRYNVNFVGQQGVPEKFLQHLFYSSFNKCLHFSKLANTFLTAPSAIANTFLSLLIFF